LPEDYLQTVNATMEALTDSNAYGGFAREILKRKWVKPNRRIFDNAKVSDHFAIIPTLVRPKHLNEIEAKLYDLVVKRFLAVFYPAAEYLVTTRVTRVEAEPFKSEGKVLVSAGWLAVYGREAQGDEPTLAPIKPDESVATEKIDVVALTTRPPPRFTEATLLSAMEGAGKLIEDEELREAMREKGLGTPATRAQIIEGLLQERYILREGKELIPTPKAFSLMTLLHGLGVPELFAPELTAEWEFKLAQMEHGKLPRRDFMREIIKMTRHIVAQAKNYESDTIPGDFATLSTPCPNCGGEVHEKYRKFQCMNPACDFAFWKIMGGRQLSPAEAETLLRERRIGPLEGFRSRLGRPFTAELKLNDANEVEFDFGESAIGGDDGEAPDFSQQTPLGPCPKCGHRVFEVGNVYTCERAVGPERSCDFRSGRTILQRPIDRVQMEKLLTTGKTDLLQFVSSRTRRPFSAYLVRQKDGSVGFEFEPRDPSKKGRPQRGVTPVRVLGMHPRDKHPVELHAGRYGPYIKHRDVNATLPDKDKMDSVTLAEAVALVDAKAGRGVKPAARTTAKEPRAKPSARQNGEENTATPPRGSTGAARAKPKPRATSRSKTAKQSKTKRAPPAAARGAAKRRSAK
jgi:DNA topoisomerase-3